MSILRGRKLPAATPVEAPPTDDVCARYEKLFAALRNMDDKARGSTRFRRTGVQSVVADIAARIVQQAFPAAARLPLGPSLISTRRGGGGQCFRKGSAEPTSNGANYSQALVGIQDGERDFPQKTSG